MSPLIASLTILLAAPTGEAIRLRCVGERVIVVGKDRQRSAWEQRFAIDLQHRIWCEADCSNHHPIVAIKPDVIDLISEAADGFATESHVNRETGAFTFLSIGQSHSQTVETGVKAQCERLDGG